MTKEQIIFLHIPKTAGTTLREIVYAQYAVDRITPIYRDERFMDMETFSQLPPEKKDAADIFIGHFAYGFHQHLSGNRPYKYATMLRHPIARGLSLYNHLKNLQFAGSEISFSELLKNKGSQFRNNQSRYIAGWGTQKMLETAIQNIEKDFLFVGITERFNESLLLASHDLGWQLKPYKRRNVTSTMWATNYADQLRNDKESMQELQKLNTIDMQLYEYANKRFSQQIASHFPNAVEKLLHFENRLHQAA
ncbi:sulfotransferase family 2 domain-containing protein [Desulfobulbus propionicus]|jgi:hypothetical protein